jgi:lincosamide nucleotidyltransferase A/C/D/E
MARLETTVADVHLYLDLLDVLGIEAWIDGGWGVDALLGAQTRPHADLDIVIQEADAPALCSALLDLSHVNIPRDDTRAWNFVMGEPDIRELDFHVVVFDDSGDGVYGPPDNEDVYPATAFAGSGDIGGRVVRCLTPEYQVSSHTGYQLAPKDIADVVALRERFGVALAPEHDGYLLGS